MDTDSSLYALPFGMKWVEEILPNIRKDKNIPNSPQVIHGRQKLTSI